MSKIVIASGATFTDVSGAGPVRNFQVAGSADAVVVFETGASSGASSGARIKDPRNPLGAVQPDADLSVSGPAGRSHAFQDAAQWVRYVLVRGTVTSVWLDSVFPGASAPGYATSAALGQVQMSVAPASAATPIAVGTNDARVTERIVALSLSGSDGSLVETIVWRAPYNCTITGAYINASVSMAANNTDYDTLTLQNRPLAGPGSPVTIVTTTTKAADLNALAAWVEESLGTVGNTAVLAGDILTFKSTASGAGKASGPAELRITYSVP